MGLIKTILGGIFGLIGSIFGGIAKIFGIGKQSEFFMELDDSGNSAPEPQAAPQAPPVSKAEKVTAPGEGVDQSSEPSQASLQAQIPSAPEDASLEKAPAVEATAAMPAIPNFATEYLVNPRINRSPRRRPGPSLSPFKDMAKSMGRKSPTMG